MNRTIARLRQVKEQMRRHPKIDWQIVVGSMLLAEASRNSTDAESHDDFLRQHIVIAERELGFTPDFNGQREGD